MKHCYCIEIEFNTKRCYLALKIRREHYHSLSKRKNYNLRVQHLKPNKLDRRATCYRVINKETKTSLSKSHTATTTNDATQIKEPHIIFSATSSSILIIQLAVKLNM
jgi:hypothetical protein